MANPIVTSVTPNIGPLGGQNLVSIVGSNFTGVVAVTFGGVNALGFTFINDNLVTATPAAASAGAVIVGVRNASGLGSLSAGYTYASDAMILNWGIGFTNSYTFDVNPWPFKPVPRRGRDRYVTANGTLIPYQRFNKWDFELTFSHIEQNQYNNFQTAWLSNGPWQLILPAGFCYPSGTFQVEWMNEFPSVFKNKYWTGGYTGTIKFNQV